MWLGFTDCLTGTAGSGLACSTVFCSTIAKQFLIIASSDQPEATILDVVCADLSDQLGLQ
jgi:hypothetical protein